MTEILTILVVEHDADDILLLKSIFNKLQSRGMEIRLQVAHTLSEAVAALNEQEYNLIVTDLYLPDSQGLDTFLELQKKASSSPIIIVGAVVEDDFVREAIKHGAQDFIPKGDLTVNLVARIISHAIERHRLHENLRALSFTDELTGTYNRRGFIALLEQQYSLAKRMKKGFYLFIIDLNSLKQINDSYGHLMGDKALVETAKCLKATFRRHDLVGRLGGDEFGVVATNAASESGKILKASLQKRVEETNVHLKDPYTLSFSIGQAYFDGLSEQTLDELVLQADKDLYEAKKLVHNIRAGKF